MTSMAHKERSQLLFIGAVAVVVMLALFLSYNGTISGASVSDDDGSGEDDDDVPFCDRVEACGGGADITATCTSTFTGDTSVPTSAKLRFFANGVEFAGVGFRSQCSGLPPGGGGDVDVISGPGGPGSFILVPVCVGNQIEHQKLACPPLTLLFNGQFPFNGGCIETPQSAHCGSCADVGLQACPGNPTLCAFFGDLSICPP